MGLFEHWPYTNFHDLNLDWVISKLKDLTTYAESAKSDANRAENAKTIAVNAQDAAESAARSAESSSRDAQAAENSAERYAAHIADPVSGLVTTWLDDNITPTTPPVDASLTVQGAAADAKATGDAIEELAESAMPTEVKLALDSMLRHMGVADDSGYGSDYAIIHAWAATVTVISISAVFDQGENLVFTFDSLESLRQYLTVTATYSDGTSGVISSYTLSGELTAGSSTITVSYLDRTAQITVNVTEGTDVTPALSSYLATSDTTLTILPNGIRVSTTNEDYKSAYVKIPLRKNYTYRFMFDVETTNGFVTVQLREGYGTASDKILVNVKPSSESGSSFVKDVIPSDSANWNDSTSPGDSYAVFYIAGPTAITTTVIYTNIRIIEYMGE